MRIIVNMACGLANRMFQYTYYLYLKSLGYDVAVDYYTSAKLAHEDVAWEKVFPNAKMAKASHLQVFRMGGGEDILSKMRRHFFPSTTCVRQMPTAFSVELPTLPKQYMMGVFQNAAMVEHVRDEMFRCFSFPDIKDAYNQGIVEQIRGCDSVAIHVRKGKDYQSRIWYQNTCPMEYYGNAVAYMKEHIENPRFFVFADNPEWVKENFKDFDYILVDANPSAGWGSHFDMQLMSLCHHNIISNSTYSWWGAYLNETAGKIVVLPKIWFNPKSCEDYTSTKLMCEGWIAL
ncbi:MAG: alpha-1,2-fucosyltransferase [Candidatus Cryptobacteroides sp.]